MFASASLVHTWKIRILLALVIRNHPVHKGPDGPKPEVRVGCSEQLAGRAVQAVSFCISCAWFSARVTAQSRMSLGKGGDSVLCPLGFSLLPKAGLLNVTQQKWPGLAFVIKSLFYLSRFSCLTFIACYLVLFSQLCFGWQKCCCSFIWSFVRRRTNPAVQGLGQSS